MSIQLYSSPMKYKDPNTGNYTNIIGISGNPGRGIASVELNNDYTLTLTFTDGTSTTTPSIRGNGIESIEKTSTSGLIDTYTITDSDSNTYTFEVTNGDVPNLTIGTVTEGEEASATITGSRENPVLNLVLPLPSLTDYVKKTDYANGINTGVVRINNNYGLTNVDASDGGAGTTTYTAIFAPTTTEIRTGTDRYKPIVPRNQHEASFYGLAKAAGDTSQAQSSNAVGTYTAGAKAAIQTMLDVPSNAAMQQAIDNINTMKIHICTSGEYDAETGVPTVQNPDAQTFYLVPGGDSGNLYIEWVYVNSVWERFGSADIDLSGYATKEEVPVEYGAKDGSVQNKGAGGLTGGTASGVSSIAIGQNVHATGNYSAAFGGSATEAQGMMSFATGWGALAFGTGSHAEGGTTKAIGGYSHAEGNKTIANGNRSHAEGSNTIANGSDSHTSGKYNIEDSYSSWPEWVANTEYITGDKIKVTVTGNNETTITGYICKTANNDAEFTMANWTKDTAMNFVEIIGNGTSAARSNARALDWEGNEYLAGDLYVGANADSSGGTRLPHDVQVAGASVVSNGVANIPTATDNVSGVVKVNSTYGIGRWSTSNEMLYVNSAPDSMIKSGGTEATAQYRPITPNKQHSAVFYGLTKAAGVDMASSANAVGTYTEEAKTAIKSMLGVQDGLRVVRLI